MLSTYGGKPEQIVLLVFSCRQLAFIHDAASTMQADRRSWKSETSDGLQEPYTCASSAYRFGQNPEAVLLDQGDQISRIQDEEDRAKHLALSNSTQQRGNNH